MNKVKKNILYVFVACIIQACNAQNAEQNCPFISNVSAKVQLRSIDSLCARLELVYQNGGGVFFYISDELPSHAEKSKIAYNFFKLKKTEKGAVVFVDFQDKKFTILYSDSLNTEQYLVARGIFGEKAYQLLKTDYTEDFFLRLVSRYEELFISKKAF